MKPFTMKKKLGKQYFMEHGFQKTWVRPLLFLMLVQVFAWPIIARAEESNFSNRIVFASNVSGNWDLWTVESRSLRVTRITNTPEAEHSPAVSPNGREILYVNQKRKIWIMQGSKRRELPLPTGIYAHPAWDPEGAQIAFVKYRVIPADASEIWIIKRNKDQWGYPERVTQFPPMRVFPSFSPDGKKMALTEFRRDKRLGVVEEIGVYHFEKKTFKKITDHGADSYKPVWSPDGERMAYTSDRAGNYDIWITNLRDGKHKQLTRNPAYDGEPSWSPEGERIVFVSTRTGHKELHIMSIAGGKPRQLTKLGKTCKDPFWVK